MHSQNTQHIILHITYIYIYSQNGMQHQQLIINNKTSSEETEATKEMLCECRLIEMRSVLFKNISYI